MANKTQTQRTLLRKKHRPLAEINVVPYIDVMLVLLVIFMITAPLLTQGGNVKLPDAQAKALAPTKSTPIIVSVDQQGLYYLNVGQKPSQPLNPQSLMTNIAAYLQLAKQRHQTREIYVKGDQNVSYGKVVEAMALIEKAGAKQVGLITQPVSDRK